MTTTVVIGLYKPFSCLFWEMKSWRRQQFFCPELSGKYSCKTFPFPDTQVLESSGQNRTFIPIWMNYGDGIERITRDDRYVSCWPADLRQALEKGIHETARDTVRVVLYIHTSFHMCNFSGLFETNMVKL